MDKVEVVQWWTRSLMKSEHRGCRELTIGRKALAIVGSLLCWKVWGLLTVIGNHSIIWGEPYKVLKRNLWWWNRWGRLKAHTSTEGITHIGLCLADLQEQEAKLTKSPSFQLPLKPFLAFSWVHASCRLLTGSAQARQEYQASPVPGNRKNSNSWVWVKDLLMAFLNYS